MNSASKTKELRLHLMAICDEAIDKQESDLAGFLEMLNSSDERRLRQLLHILEVMHARITMRLEKLTGKAEGSSLVH